MWLFSISSSGFNNHSALCSRSQGLPPARWILLTRGGFLDVFDKSETNFPSNNIQYCEWGGYGDSRPQPSWQSPVTVKAPPRRSESDGDCADSVREFDDNNYICWVLTVTRLYTTWLTCFPEMSYYWGFGNLIIIKYQQLRRVGVVWNLYILVNIL